MTGYLCFSHTREFWAYLLARSVSVACKAIKELLKGINSEGTMTNLLSMETYYEAGSTKEDRLEAAIANGFGESMDSAISAYENLSDKDKKKSTKKESLAAAITFHLIEDIECGPEWVLDESALDEYVRCLQGKNVGTPDVDGIEPKKPTLGPLSGLRDGLQESTRDKFARAISLVSVLNRLNSSSDIRYRRSPFHEGCKLADFGASSDPKFCPAYMVGRAVGGEAADRGGPDLVDLATSPEPAVPESHFVLVHDLVLETVGSNNPPQSMGRVPSYEFPTYCSSGANWRDTAARRLQLDRKDSDGKKWKFGAIRMCICSVGASIEDAASSLRNTDSDDLMTVFCRTPSRRCPPAQR